MTKFVQYTASSLATEETALNAERKRERERERTDWEGTRRKEGKAAPSDTALAVGAMKEW